MSKFRSRLLFGFITLIIVVLIALGLLLGQLFKNFYLHTYNNRIEKEVNLLSYVVQNEDIYQSETKAKLEDFSQTLQSRILMITKDGSILFDSQSKSNGKDYQHIRTITRNHLHDKNGFYELREEYKTYYYGSPILQNGNVEGFVLLSSPVDSLKKVNQQIWLILLGSLGMAFAVILALGYQLASQYMKPIESATNVAIQLAKGNYRARIYDENQDETTMLSRSLNILARNLQEITKAHEMQQDRLQALIENMGSSLILIDSSGYIILINRAFKETFHIKPIDYLHQLYYKVIPYKEIKSLVESIFKTEKNVRKQILLPLKIERKHFDVYGVPILGSNHEWKGVVLVFHDITELKKLEQVRKDFVANVSHELKTPITSIKGFSETLLDGAMKDDTMLEYFLSIILKESERLQSLIQDLLDLSKIEQQGFILNFQPVNIVEVINEIFIMLKEKAKKKKLSLTLTSDCEQVIMSGDTYRLKQIFLNLINNAIQYTPEAGTIMVKLQADEKNVVIHVIDSGIGIRQDEVPRIFERFYRIDKARSRHSGGTGLGLAIVKHLVEAHHGSISVNSVVGKGTTFTVTFLSTYF